MKTRREERAHSKGLCELVFESDVEFPHDEMMRLVVPPIYMDDDIGGMMRFCAWHTPHYISRLLQDAEKAAELEDRVIKLEARLRLADELAEEERR